MEGKPSRVTSSYLDLPAQGSVLSFAHLSYHVKSPQGEKTLVDDVSVDVKAGQLLAIMVNALVTL